MEKPTIFFSHSSKDRDLILPIKNKLSEVTSGVIKIFMSSDGQSIPFGNNWVHKIEEGLHNSKIMFVFVTQNSINNAWVYFESGFAYSKGIEVIPVGIGISVGDLKPPLNLLQGFNVTSGDSLNNFISIINQKFELNFKEGFTNTDYEYIKALKLHEEYDISKIFSGTSYKLFSQYSSTDNKIIRYDLQVAIEAYKSYLDDEKINYSFSKDYLGNETLLFNGVRIARSGREEEPKNYNGKLHPNQTHNLIVSISTNNFPISFELFKKMNKFNENLPEFNYLTFHLKSSYLFNHDNVELSSILEEKSEFFSPAKNNVGGFLYKESLSFNIYEMYKYQSSIDNEYVLNIGFLKSHNPGKEIIELVTELVDLNIIYKKD